MPVALAQSALQPEATPHAEVAALPDAPGEAFRSIGNNSVEVVDSSSTSAEASSDAMPTAQRAPQRATASRWSKLVLPGQQAPVLTDKDKFLLGAKDSVSLYSMTGWVFSAGFSQLLNKTPNYGTDKGAYGQRLGAASIRNISEDIFGTSVMAPILREDPRYYRMGRGHSVTRRAVYAATRLFITRTDSGRATPNLALFTGNLEAAALTNAYYPARNRGASQTMLTFGASLGGSMIGFGVSEFLGDALELAHIKKSE
ncbi:hypothetical protein [Edaphobacter dinghuensis]|uniref:Uncharacterized protein n=1 Tax=Edaphobacter dinghuensis TaxID=1560005 RepID=A0A917H105_9BACT|nr:hypothetical protein [Edaphobacter dinghuensis]GGG64095.1 hypothetical protein GCM10011585_02110 [Edaphobacter dinghuensis]